jgi:hypothetical protein
MSVIQNNLLLTGGDEAFDVTNSLRLRSSASAYLSRTPTSAGSLTTWTWSAWIKRGTLGATQNLFGTTTEHKIYISGGDALNFQFDNGVNNYRIATTQVFRDPSAWYHVMVVWNTTSGTTANRMRFYVNGSEVTTLSVSNYPTQNFNGGVNTTVAHYLGNLATTQYFDGYMAEVNFVDGQALTPSSFGSTNASTGVWQPKAYTGTYGTNGFYFPMNQSDLLKTFQRSLRFRGSASAYLNRTPSSAGNRQTWTYSTWVKRGALNGSIQFLMCGGSNSSGQLSTQFQFDGSNRLYLYDAVSGSSSNIELVTTAVYRDPSAWYHIVLVADTTQSTASNRIKLYVNGVQVTSFSTATYPSQNYNTAVNNNVLHNISNLNNLNVGLTLDGYVAETIMVDGFALTPYSFGQIDDTTGAWQPITYTGQYGTNGFYLPFTDTTSTTTLGYDSSGRGNNWTTNNISLTAGATYDSMTDVPTLTSATAANFAVMNPIDSAASTKPQYANLRLTNSNSTHSITRGTIGVTSGKWYWETTVSSTMANFYSGVATDQTNISSTTTVGGDAYSWAYVGSNGEKRYNSSSSSYGSALVNGDVLGCALDLDSGKIYWSINGTWQGSGNPSAGTNPAFTGVTGTCFPAGGTYNMTIDYNFGQRPFTYTPPTGYVALNAYNI